MPVEEGRSEEAFTVEVSLKHSLILCHNNKNRGRHASIIVPGMQQLSDIAKLPLLQRESPTRVREIWLEKFRESSRVVAGTISDQEYEPLSANMHSCPMFLVPVARGSGYMNYVWLHILCAHPPTQ